MFDFVRRHTKAMQLMLFLLIVPSFALFGIDGYNRFRENSATVAEVDGQSITQPEWDAAHKSEVDRIRASMPTLDAKLLDSPEAKYATLERLVRERVLSVAAEKSRLATSDQRLARDLQNNPAIAELRRPDGSLDMERYRQLLGSQGMTPEMFEARVRADLSVQQVVQGVTSTGLVSNAVADMALQAYFEKREIQLGRFNTTDFQAKVALSDADLEAYYKANPGLFQAPEQASIEYLVLDPESLRKNLSVSEADLKTYYEQNTQRLGGQEERRASHILITAPKTASAEEPAPTNC
jgi:peptidyl-prolyl cis-trans isomerase D